MSDIADQNRCAFAAALGGREIGRVAPPATAGFAIDRMDADKPRHLRQLPGDNLTPCLFGRWAVLVDHLEIEVFYAIDGVEASQVRSRPAAAGQRARVPRDAAGCGGT